MTRAELEALKDGDPDAFGELVMQFTGKLRRMAMTFFESPFEQEEALQETFLHIFRNRATIDPARSEAFEGFITTLARHKMIDMGRNKHPHVELETQVASTDAVDPQHQVEANQLHEIMSRFEERLKPGLKPYFRAVFINGQDEHEARVSLEMEPRRARYVKRVLLEKLRKHRPLIEHLEQEKRRGGSA